MRARSLSVVPLIALVAGALAGSAGAQAPLPPPVSADSVAACRAECEWIACGESPPEPVVGTDSLGALPWSSHCGTAEMNLTRNHEVAVSIPGLAQWVKDLALP